MSASLPPFQLVGAREPKSTIGERQLEVHLRAAGLIDYKREYRFHPTRKWRFDFAFVKEKLAVEVEGGIWIKGAHTRGAHFESDAEKYNEALLLGWRVLRVSTKMARDGRALAWIRRALEAEGCVVTAPIFACGRIDP